jgi:hypothetical protein
VAVPNLLFEEADKKYFGVGDTKGAAIKDCLGKIKDVPIDTLVSSGSSDDPQEDARISPELEEESKLRQSFWRLPRILTRSGSK